MTDLERKAAENAVKVMNELGNGPINDTHLERLLNDAFIAGAEYRPPAGMPSEGCGVCGGKTALIRGRYPGRDNRRVCPTCLADRVETIREMLTPNEPKSTLAEKGVTK